MNIMLYIDYTQQKLGVSFDKRAKKNIFISIVSLLVIGLLINKFCSSKMIPVANFTVLDANIMRADASKFSLYEKIDDGYVIPTFIYQIQKGDNLSSIFAQLGFSYNTLMQIMETDLNYLALDTLNVGNNLVFWRNELNGQLEKMELQFSLADKVEYVWNGEVFDFKNISIPGDWHQELIIGEIRGSFSSSAYNLGLSVLEIDQIFEILKEQLDFAKDLQAGDRFELVRQVQTVDGVATNKTELEAIKIYNKKRIITAYLHTDGQFYSATGKSLQRAFQRYPVDSKWRISSHFNPSRKHPVLKRVVPHNGTDFAVPTGTPVFATGDGIVSIVQNHPYAGKYVVISHGSKYKTRYLHLNKVLVKRGQTVERGQKIALSGETGRITGAHLHYELIVNNRAVDAMKADIPMAKSVSKKEFVTFRANRDLIDQLLKEQARLR